MIQFVNYGEDPHDMRVQRVGGTKIYGTPIMQPGQIYNLSLKLVPGKYQLWCSIANHRRARDGGDADREAEVGPRRALAHPAGCEARYATNGVTAAVACAAVKTFGRSGAGNDRVRADVREDAQVA